MKLALSHTLFSIYLSIFSLIFTTGKIAQAQITPDSSNINTQVNQNGGVAEITGGQTRGGNLFHSFQDFSVPTSNEAFFNNADNISNIFSRVTGGNISNIDGAIRANGSASLFLINPAGIIFGENARLDIGGSFYGTSASSVLFEDGEFSAADLTTPPVLTINAPIGLGFRDNPGEITSSSLLQILPSETIAFVGGDVTLNNGSIFTPGGNIEIGGLAEPGTVSINNNILAFPEAVERGNVSIANGSLVAIAGAGGGSININARNFELLSGSLFFAGIDEGLGTPETQGGSISIDAQENLQLDPQRSGNAAIFNINSGTGNLGDISLTARNITFSNGGTITNANTGQGNIGNIDLIATENIVFDGTQGDTGLSPSGIQNIVTENGGGNVASVNITAQNLSVINGASIGNLVAGIADNGDINLNIADTINISGTGEVFDPEINSLTLPSEISVEVFRNGIGNAGSININTQNLILSNNGVIDASTIGQGNGGDINITANTIDIQGGGDNTLVFSSIVSDAFGDLSDDPDAFSNGGNIQIETNVLSLRNGGNISASNFITGNGDGGSISIDVTDNISIDGRGIVLSEGEENIVASGIFANILSSDVVGRGGNITIDTPELSITNGAQINSFTRGEGDAGDISIFSNSIELAGNNSSIGVSAEPESTGNGGNLTIETVDLTVDDASSIAVLTFGEGDAGSLQINAIKSIQLSGFDDNRRGGLIASALDSSGNGGDINISTNQLTIREGATVTASNFPSSESSDVQPGTGEAGSINIEANSISLDTEGRIDVATQSSTGEGANINLQVAEDITLRNNSFISAQAFNLGNGGNLSIDSRFVIAFPSNGNGSDIIASAERGQGGNITINAESLFGISEGSIREEDNSNNINASSQVSGLDGIVEIATPDLNPVQGATELPSNVVEPGETTAQACEANREALAKNGLNITGKGGVIPAPDLPLEAHNVLINGQSTSEIPQGIETSQGKILPARGVKRTESGEVILTAYRTNNLGERIPEIKMNCGS